MAHRGRLNVLAHIVGRHLRGDPGRVRGAGRGARRGDAEGRLRRREVPPRRGGHLPDAGRRRAERDPVTEPEPPGGGRTRSSRAAPAPQQTDRRAPLARHDRQTTLPILIHGDAAFAGAGRRGRDASTWRGCPATRTGGTIHIIANNQIGFTTGPREGSLHPLLQRPGQGLRHTDHPRQRRRPGGLPGGGPAGDDVPPALPRGRGDRPGRLPPLRPQRGRRAGLHPAADVRGGSRTPDGARAVRQALVKAGVISRREADAGADDGSATWPSARRSCAGSTPSRSSIARPEAVQTEDRARAGDRGPGAALRSS